MQLLRDAHVFEGQSVLALGVFDGIHIAHQRLLKQVKERATLLGVKSGVVLFEQPPAVSSTFASPEGIAMRLRHDPPRMPLTLPLTTMREKEELIEELGLDFLFLLTFDEKKRHKDDMALLQYLYDKLSPHELWLEEDLTLADIPAADLISIPQGGGPRSTLRNWAEALGAIQTLPPPKVHRGVPLEGQAVSSERIRVLLKEGAIAEATRLLGRPPSVRGIVQGGNEFGRHINFRTANIYPDLTRALPADGGYITYTILPNGERIPSTTTVWLNIPPEGFGKYIALFDWTGYEELKRPIEEHPKPRIETHLIDWSGDLYKQEIVIEFIAPRPREGSTSLLSVKGLIEANQRSLQLARMMHAELK